MEMEFAVCGSLDASPLTLAEESLPGPIECFGHRLK